MNFYKIPHKQMLAIICVVASMAFAKSTAPGLEVSYFGFEDAVNRAGSACNVFVRIINKGKTAEGLKSIALSLPDGVSCVSEPVDASIKALKPGRYEDFIWKVLAEESGKYEVALRCRGRNAPASREISLEFTQPLGLPKASYVPKPQPVKTDIELFAYYFPRWQFDYEWDCIRRITPIRKPLLGWYDESNPEAVDWQIKWAVENGITGFLMDWYWIKEKPKLDQWFGAYKKAKYRNYLKLMIMWANHPPFQVKSAENFKKAVQYWIDEYFCLNNYYKIDGKPVVGLWDSKEIRNSLGDSKAVRDAFDDAQKMAQQAGYKGIYFIETGWDFSTERRAQVVYEGYHGMTTYHAWTSPEPKHDSRVSSYADIARLTPQEWDRIDYAVRPLRYFPVVSTGWDSRPWYGDKAEVIPGRTSDLFEELLRNSKSYCYENNKSVLIFAPVNEWGEGSYIEPCTEYGFGMYEAIRKVFGKGQSADWPANYAPSDVGLGPYDFPPVQFSTQSSWTFDKDLGYWNIVDGVKDMRYENGALRLATTSEEPFIRIRLKDVDSADYKKAIVKMRVVGELPEEGAKGRFYWTCSATEMGDACMIPFDIPSDGKMHTYELDVSAKEKWTRLLTGLYLNPCNVKGAEVVVDEIRFE